MNWLHEHAWIAAPVTAALTLAMLWLNRRALPLLPFDAPNLGRKQHGARTPLAGIAMLPTISACLLANDRPAVAAVVLALGATGFVDDWHKEGRRELDWRIKALALGAGSIALAWQHANPLSDAFAFCAAASLAFVLINATNFLDNQNGALAAIAASCLLLAGGSHGPFAAAAFTALGFLPCNWPKAKCFAGDAGAYALGACIAAQLLERPLSVDAIAPFAVPLFDFTQVVLVRLALGLKPWVGDRRHVTHWMLAIGAPRVLVAPLLALAAVAVVWVTR